VPPAPVTDVLRHRPVVGRDRVGEETIVRPTQRFRGLLAELRALSGRGNQTPRQLVEDVGELVEPVPLRAGLRSHVAHSLPEAKGPVAHRADNPAASSPSNAASALRKSPVERPRR
jgi:hypothetical protein